MSDLKQLLANAWEQRKQSGIFNDSDALRVFHGPGEGDGILKSYAIDRFGDHYWITHWQSPGALQSSTKDPLKNEVIDFYRSQGAKSIVLLSRPAKGALPSEPQTLWGEAPTKRVSVREFSNSFWIQMCGARHPGLFLDHLPLRVWLERHCKGLRVLNTFAYTGSLSVAAQRGGASHVTTLDLSQPSVQWAQDNMALNDLEQTSQRWVSGDVFEWLPRWKKSGEKFDCIILDPPSFSHGKKSSFSTQKDLMKLHSLAMELLSEQGILVTSINSANLSWKRYETDILAAAASKKMKFCVLNQIDLPETFPTVMGDPSERYLKGWILRRMR